MRAANIKKKYTYVDVEVRVFVYKSLFINTILALGRVEVKLMLQKYRRKQTETDGEKR